MTDTLRTLIFDQSSCRAHLVHLSKAWQQVVNNNDYPKPVQRVLGELVAASAMLSASLKFEGSLIIQIQGDGPIRLLVAECNSRLGLRATVKLLEGTDIPEDACFKDLVNATGKGICAIILDPRNRLPGQAPYQGIVPLSGTSVADSLEAYMHSSEQLETRLILNSNSTTAAGVMLQQMPQHGGVVSNKEFDADGWDRLKALINTLQAEEHLTTDTDELAKRLFWEEDPDGLAERQAHFECSCSREKVGKMLVTLGQAELNEALSENPTVEIQCDFCNANYSFTRADCEALFTETSHEDASQNPQPPTLH
ncbi:Hsp33 family molecular chaperone HslO [Limnobacter sp.]|jgi:molecular chaperone Hsp33|uniref:Hsp33 family molecular chaperone HslO n=1 Tax=Limnobacter sp. TaxID=2003368 RepID=UPI0025D95F86|nr:Hsp33 family molecular chaperone HslO [uncultured Limnobacter sp.]